MKKNYYYVDMDGVLADFYSVPNAVEVFATQPNFFADLKPIEENVKAVKELIKNGESVRILSISPNARCDHDKRIWLAKYLPELAKRNIIILRKGESKVEHMPTKYGILFDDFGKNIREWETKINNKGCKITARTPINYWVSELA